VESTAFKLLYSQDDKIGLVCLLGEYDLNLITETTTGPVAS